MPKFCRKFFLLIIATSALFVCAESFAVPSQIVIIRHADKITYDGKETGPALDATGYLRSVKFAFYYLQKFGEPDFIIASNPNLNTDHVKSIRELQTIAPLANILQNRHRDVPIRIYDPDTVKMAPDLATRILTHKEYDHKKIVICWEHHRIPILLKNLGIKTPITAWPDDDFDSVYVLHFNNVGQLVDYQLLHHQYPIQPTQWEDYLKNNK